MDNIEKKDFLFRVNSMDIKKFLADSGFSELEIYDGISAFTNKHYPHIIYVNQDNTWDSSQNLNERKSMIELGTILFNYTVPQFLDLVKQHPDLPNSYRPEDFFDEDNEPRNLLSEPGPMRSSIAEQFFNLIKLPMEFVERYCNEFKLTIGNDSTIYLAYSLKAQTNLNHLMLTSEIITYPELTSMFTEERHGKTDHLFIDRGRDTVDVFTSILDLLVKQYQYDRLNIQAPDQMLLTDAYAFENARWQMESHKQVNLYLPNEPKDDIVKAYATWLSPKYRDFSMTFKPHQTLADAHIMQPKTGQLHQKRPGRSR